jgi:HK97 family phage major capsid protein
MADIVTMSQADLERLVDQRLRAARDSQSQPTNGGAINVRPDHNQSTVHDDDRSRDSGVNTTWRGSANPFSQRRSAMTAEQANNVLRFFQGVGEHDRSRMERSLEALGMPRERLQSVGVSADGGYTVPEVFISEVLIDLPKVTPFADSNIVRIVPMTGETLRWTKVVARPANPAYVAEGTSYGKTGVTFAPITLVAKKIGEIIPFTEEITRANSIAMVQVISSLVSDAFAFKYNSLVTSGNGDAQEPEGVLTNANIAQVAWTATNDQTRADSLIEIFHGLASQYRGSAIWLLNDATIKLVRKLKDTQGRYLWTDGFGASPATILGRPVFENPDLPTTNILFGNFLRGYVIGRKDGMTVDQNSSGTDWEKDIVNYKFRERWDGRVHDEKAFVNGTGVA